MACAMVCPGRRAPWASSLLCLAVALPSAGEEPAKARSLDPELLALCRSSDPAARRYCLHAIAAQGDPGGEAKQVIADMAAHDPVFRDEAAGTYARLYGTAPAYPSPRALCRRRRRRYPKVAASRLRRATGPTWQGPLAIR